MVEKDIVLKGFSLIALAYRWNMLLFQVIPADNPGQYEYNPLTGKGANAGPGVRKKRITGNRRNVCLTITPGQC